MKMAQRSMGYRMYIDEVGNADLKSSDNPNHRFLSLTGVIIELNYVKKTLHPKIESLKVKYFNSHPDDPVILHRKEMVNAKPPFEILRDIGKRKQFDNDIQELLEKSKFTVISVCLDKKNHKETYTSWRYDPYHYCLMLLLERYVFFLEKNSTKGDVMAESRGGKEDRRLKDSFARLWERGNEYVSPDRFQQFLTSKQLKVKPKANNITGLQLADIIAHPSRNEILKENTKMKMKIGPFANKVIQILQKKYYQQEGRIIDFGKKFLQQKKRAFAGPPMALAIHLRITGLVLV